MYIQLPCARRAHRNPPTYIHPPIVGMLYPILTYIYSTDTCSQNCCHHNQYKYTFSKMYIPRPQKPSNLHSSPKCWHGISNMNKYIQLTYTPQIVGSIYPIQICIFINVHFQTVCPKRTQNPSDLHSSLNCWQHISNTTKYFL